MRLADALRLGPGRVAAFTGAGGKTSAIARVVRELRSELPVLVTTSTRIGRDQAGLAAFHRVITRSEELQGLRDLLRARGSVLVTGPAAPSEPKWLGLRPDDLDLAAREADAVAGCTLVEADGAHGASLKAPAEHEPVIPSRADLVVPVAGLDVIGAALAAPAVHRPERVAALVGKEIGATIEPADLIRVLTARDGGLKGVPPAAEVRVLLNKVDRWAGRRDPAEIAAGILVSTAIQAVVIGQAATDVPSCDVHGRIAGVVLAAGGSRRLGQAKQLLDWRGHPLVWHAAQAACQGGLAPVIVVAGAEAPAIRDALRNEPVRVVVNPDWEDGQSTSLRSGLEAAAGGVEGVVFLLSDTPFVDAPVIQELVRTHRRTLAPIVAPQVLARWANPVLFDRSTFSALREIRGDRGGRVLFDRFAVTGVPWQARILVDVDTPEDLARLEEQG